jgi:tRNA 2-selenouridine synthase
MDRAIRIEDFIRTREAWQIIDVRSPGEFKAGHIPGAINIPLFSDEERAKVGTIYTQISPEEAFREGLTIAGRKMTDLVDAVQPCINDPNKKLLIHCWRGGKRSKAVQWLYDFSGAPSYRLEGGYKAFRTALQTFFTSRTFELRILGGCTGAGKTEILEAMKQRGAQVIDLEALAHHKGSAFGSIGEKDQPTSEQFENNLYTVFLRLDPGRPVWLENESKSIGRTHIPDGLWDQMRESMLYAIDVDKEIRLDRALKYYSEPIDIELLKFSFEKIHKRLGGLDYQLAVKALEERDLRTAAAIALTYYDKAYNFQLSHWPSDKVVHLGACNEVEETADKLINI